jgi:hypothetical protein
MCVRNGPLEALGFLPRPTETLRHAKLEILSFFGNSALETFSRSSDGVNGRHNINKSLKNPSKLTLNAVEGNNVSPLKDITNLSIHKWSRVKHQVGRLTDR